MPQDDSMQYIRQGQAPEKVTGVNLFYLSSIDRGTANVSYLLARLVSDQGLRSLSVVTTPRTERQPDVVARAPRVAEDAPAADEDEHFDALSTYFLTISPMENHPE
nr:hypothetical protein [Tanacetum cinerariifolium]